AQRAEVGFQAGERIEREGIEQSIPRSHRERAARTQHPGAPAEELVGLVWRDILDEPLSAYHVIGFVLVPGFEKRTPVEPGRDTRGLGIGVALDDHLIRKVDAFGLNAPTGSRYHQLAGAAAHIEETGGTLRPADHIQYGLVAPLDHAVPACGLQRSVLPVGRGRTEILAGLL